VYDAVDTLRVLPVRYQAALHSTLCVVLLSCCLMFYSAVFEGGCDGIDIDMFDSACITDHDGRC
jgi:hypothetical protein